MHWLASNVTIVQLSSICWARLLRICSTSTTGSFSSREPFFWLSNSCVAIEFINHHLPTYGSDPPTKYSHSRNFIHRAIKPGNLLTGTSSCTYRMQLSMTSPLTFVQSNSAPEIPCTMPCLMMSRSAFKGASSYLTLDSSWAFTACGTGMQSYGQ
jgi:serine/threonine protein kinase